MRPDVSLCPVTFAVCAIELAGNKESTYIVISVACHCMTSETQSEIHSLFAGAAAVLVKTSPRPGRGVHLCQYFSEICARQHPRATSPQVRRRYILHHGLSSVPYQCRTISPKKIQVS